MKIKAYSLTTFVILDDEQHTWIYRTKPAGNNSASIVSSQKLSEYAVTRLGDVGFRLVDVDVSSLDEGVSWLYSQIKKEGFYVE